MKKILVILLALVLTACSNNTAANPNDKKISIGILQLMSHDALDNARLGFMDGLKEQGYAEIDFEIENPEGDQSNLSTMADHLLNNNHDLILAIATPAAQQLISNDEDTPIIATAITDYVGAGLIESNDKPGGLLSGTSDNCPMDKQLELLLEVLPDLKTLGILYTSSEVNSEIQANQMIEECEKREIKTLVKTISDKTMIDDTLQSMVNEIDALYIPTDNNIASAMGSVDIVCKENKIPTLVGESNMCKNGALLSLGVDYYSLGKITAEMAIEVLNGKNIAELPIRFDETGTIYYNSKTAEQLGILLPEKILQGEDKAQ